jgi:hypothetical protein
MTGFYKGIALGCLQIAIILSLACKLLYDRETRPRLWVQCQGYDPELPIRGRYLAERLSMPADGFKYTEPQKPNLNAWYINRQWAYFSVHSGQLVAGNEGSGSGGWVYLRKNGDGTLIATTEEPVLIFISDRASIPVTKAGQQIWAEVTVPKNGPLRPIRLAIKNDTTFTPLEIN